MLLNKLLLTAISGWIFGKNRRSQASGFFPSRQFITFLNGFDADLSTVSIEPQEGKTPSYNAQTYAIICIIIKQSFAWAQHLFYKSDAFN